MIILNEENRELRGKLFPIPKGVKEHLKKTLSNYEERDGNKNNDGYDRLVYLCGQERITMEELKRIKNFFDNYKGTPQSDDYILNGGNEMSDWINRVLKVATDTSKNEKEAKELTGLDNKNNKNIVATPRVGKLKQDKVQTKNLSNSISKNSTVKESKTVVVTEKQLKYIKEAYNRETFFYDELEKLCEEDEKNGTNLSYDYCVEKLGPEIGSGTERAVFELTDNWVLKIKKYPDRETPQNYQEIENTKTLNENGIDIIPRIIKYSPNYYWMVCESVIPCRINDFDHILGVPYIPTENRGNINDKWTKDFGNHAEYEFEKHPYTEKDEYISIEGFIEFIKHDGEYTHMRDIPYYIKLKEENEWFVQFAELIKITDMYDFHVENFGMALRNGNPTILIIDLGM